MKPNQAILYGGTGQAKVVRAILEPQGVRIVLVVDDTPALTPPFADVPLVCGLAGLKAWLAQESPASRGFCITIGAPHGLVRVRLATQLCALGLTELSAIHMSAVIDPSATIGPGLQAMAGAIVQPHARIGRQCILNTKASVDHDCVLDDGVDVSPGATVCGEVRIERGAWIASGATVLPRLSIGAGAIVGAGSLVREDVPPGATVVGVPAVPIRSRQSN